MNWIKKSLFAKLLVGTLAASVIPFLLSNIVAYQTSSSSVKRQVIALNQHAMSIGMKEIKKYFSGLSLLAVNYYNDQDTMNIFRSPSGTSFEALHVNEVLIKTFASRFELKAVNFKSAVSGRNYTLNNKGYALPIPAAPIPAKPDNDWERTNEFQIARIGNEDVLMVNRLLVDYPYSNVLGMTTLYVGVDEIAGIVSGTSDPSQHVTDFFLIHEKPQLLFASSWPDGDERIHELAALTKAKSGYLNGEWDGEQGVYIYTTDSFRQMPLTLIRFVPESTFNRAANQTLGRSLIVQFIAIAFVIGMVTLLSYYFILRMKRIMRSIARVQSGNFKVEMGKRASDELGILEERFQNMVQQLDVLINREYRNNLELSNARLKMLQSQINPHFLYNTLQSIGTLALDHGVAEISDKIAELGDMFRYSMDTKTEVVTLQTELKHLENYLSLQGVRFVNKLSYTICCSQQLYDIPVPKMILQPLVENSIVHGMEKGQGSGIVHVLIDKEDSLQIRIIDNGRGLEPATIDWLKSRYAENQLKSNDRIGLLNVLHRLQLYYGQEFHWDIQSVPYEITIISLHIPIQSAERRTEP